MDGLILAGCVLVVCAALALPAVFRWRARQLDELTQCLETFSESASTLLRDPETPESIRETIFQMARVTDDARFGRFIFSRALSGDLRNKVERPPEDLAETMRDIESLRTDLKDAFGKAAVASVLSATFHSVVVGPFLRRAIFFSVTRSHAQAEYVLSSYARNIAGHKAVAA